MNNTEIRNNLSRFRSAKVNQLRQLRCQLEELDAEIATLNAAHDALGESQPKPVIDAVDVTSVRALFDALRTRGTAWIGLKADNMPEKKYGILQSVQREDGSGMKFIVTLIDERREQIKVFANFS